MATMKDIAKKANVSICTVSKYLDRTMKVKPETAVKIEAAIEELNYIPNVVAKALKKNVTSNVAVILPNINNLYYSEMTSGISKVLEQNNFNLYIFETAHLNYTSKQIMQLMIENMVAGVILVSLSYDLSFKDELEILTKQNIPVVYVNRFIPYEGVPLVYPNFTKAAKLSAGHLSERGTSKAAICINNAPKELVDDYILIFEKIFGEKPYIIDIGTTELHGDYSHVACEIMQKGINGIFVLNELKAVMISKALQERGVKVGEEVRLISFGKSLASRMCTPELTCIDLQNKLLGAKSAGIILDQINKRNFENVTVVEPTLVLGHSS